MRRPAPRLVMARAHLREIGSQLLLVLGGTLLLVALGAAVRVSSKSQGAPLWMALAFFPHLVGTAVPYLLPAALLTAVVLAYGRMAAEGEATALRAAGVHPWRILVPALLCGGAVTLASYPLSAELLPRLYSQMREITFRLRYAALENTDPAASELGFGGLHLSWRGRDPLDGAFLDALLVFRDQDRFKAHRFDPGRDDAPARPAAPPAADLRLRAERATMRLAGRELRFAFQGLRTLDEDPAAVRWSGAGVTHVAINLDDLGRRKEGDLKAADYRSAELREALADPALAPADAARFRFALWQRAALALAALPLAAIGALLGWRLRRAGVLSAFGAAFAIQLLLYYPLYYLGDALGRSGGLPPAAAALLPLGGLALALVFLLPRGRRA